MRLHAASASLVVFMWSCPIRLGGPGATVQIDESLFARAKHNRGHALHLPQVWIFGLYDPDRQEGYLRLVDARDGDTLYPIIEEVLRPGSVICSDEWAAYRRITQQPHPQQFQHRTVNHQQHYVDPVTGCTTNHVEAYLSRVKKRVKRKNGLSRLVLPAFLDECMWRDRFGKTSASAFQNILLDIAARFPC